MAKLEIGDLVKIKSEYSKSEGLIGKVTDSDNFFNEAVVEVNSYKANFKQDSLEFLNDKGVNMFTFNVGDRVKIKSERSVSYNDIGTVIGSDPLISTVKVNGYKADFNNENLERVNDSRVVSTGNQNITMNVDVKKEITVNIELHDEDAELFMKAVEFITEASSLDSVVDMDEDVLGLFERIQSKLV